MKIIVSAMEKNHLKLQMDMVLSVRKKFLGLGQK
jgi:hypothetical protein